MELPTGTSDQDIAKYFEEFLAIARNNEGWTGRMAFAV
jgi:hypothetical protein